MKTAAFGRRPLSSTNNGIGREDSSGPAACQDHLAADKRTDDARRSRIPSTRKETRVPRYGLAPCRGGERLCATPPAS
jgi:hypothetical protein